MLEEIVKKNLDAAWIDRIKESHGYPKYHTAVKTFELPYYENGKDGS